ncbi:hypothetical protein ACUUL3_09895 [Thiovibrio sp. JS02]
MITALFQILLGLLLTGPFFSEPSWSTAILALFGLKFLLYGLVGVLGQFGENFPPNP